MPVRMLFDDGTVLELVADPLLERRLVQLLGGIRTKTARAAEVSGR
ncbi:MAG TPA: hypothetical protein VE712_04145 [Actinomycetota bacterium]|nr:hypothetical protein [Actinomycetota bacterium]